MHANAEAIAVIALLALACGYLALRYLRPMLRKPGQSPCASARCSCPGAGGSKLPAHLRRKA